MSIITTYPLNGIDYDARDAAGYNATRTSGVYSAEEDFAVTPVGGVKVTVSAGQGWVRPARFEGYSIIMREAETLTLALADGQRPRIDRIVLRFDAASRKSSLLVLQGTPDTQPTAPAISRTVTVYDLCLAEVTRPAGSTSITAAHIKDTRTNEALCGIMRDGVAGIPTEQLRQQWSAAQAQQEADARASQDALVADLRTQINCLTAEIDKLDDGSFYTKGETDSALAKKLDKSGGTMTGPIIMPGGGSVLGVEDNAATHNMVYRGKALGTSVTSEQWAAIKAGTFKDLYLGDYWSIGGVDYLIAAFNYWLACGDTACTANHLLVVPRNNLYSASMNSGNTTTGGYVGSEMYKTGLAQAKTTINRAFGSAHILNHRQYLVNAVTNGKPTGSGWYDSTVELMNENMVYGGRQLSPMPDGNDPWKTCYNCTIDKSQLPLFRLAPWLICSSNFYWLRDVVSATTFAEIDSASNANCSITSVRAGVRPVVGLM